MDNNHVKILVVDDEAKMRELIALYLTKENYTVVTAENGQKAIEEIEKHHDFDLYLLDVMMPQMDGFTLCKEIKGFSGSPVIFLTAKGEEYERLMGFDLGADDYMVKPFSPREMVARVKAVLKRSGTITGQGVKMAGDLRVDIDGREVTLAGETLALTPKEFDLLVYLIRHKGKVLSRELIMENVWDDQYYDPRTIDTHIKKLREKLGDNGDKYIKTIWGIGYKFEVN